MDANYIRMQQLLKHNVPRFIAHMEARGGVQQREWDWLDMGSDESLDNKGKVLNARNESLEFILDRADETLLYPKNHQVFGDAIALLVRAVAIMSYLPGGIRMCQYRFSHKLPGYVEYEP